MESIRKGGVRRGRRGTLGGVTTEMETVLGSGKSAMDLTAGMDSMLASFGCTGVTGLDRSMYLRHRMSSQSLPIV